MQTQNPEKVVNVVNDCASDGELQKELTRDTFDTISMDTSRSSKLLGKRFKPQEFSHESLYLEAEVPTKKAKIDKNTIEIVRHEVQKIKAQLLME